MTAGLDIGSRTVKVVLLKEREIVEYRIGETGTDPIGNARALLDGLSYDSLAATGYGRHLAREIFACPIMTEIKAFSLGAAYFYPGGQTIIDVGGQDCKVIRMDNGRVGDFEMNDRCAAGTGKFLEVMAQTLGYRIEEFGIEAMNADGAVNINSMCTVFAESEVISLIARGTAPAQIALGLHQAIANRIMTMLGKTGYGDRIVFAGGAAKNQCLVRLLEHRLGQKLHVPQEPQIIGALGAALAIITKKEIL